jgi:S1-C subfamily serine protease
VLKTLDRFMPSPAKTMFSDFRRLLNSNSTYAEVFSGIGQDRILAIPAPDPAVLNSPGYQNARSRVVKVQGTAPSCGRQIEGSGFVISPQHILTNAHVVAGVTQSQQVTTSDGQALPAHVVFYDPQVDVAVLYVPGLELRPLSFASQANMGDGAVVSGYPLNATTLQDTPARIGDIQNAQGPNIYQTTTVTRQIYEIKAHVQEGNSGGPLLSPSGTVYGVVFAAAVGVDNTGFALTATQVLPDAQAGMNSVVPVSTQSCD